MVPLSLNGCDGRGRAPRLATPAPTIGGARLHCTLQTIVFASSASFSSRSVLHRFLVLRAGARAGVVQHVMDGSAAEFVGRSVDTIAIDHWTLHPLLQAQRW